MCECSGVQKEFEPAGLKGLGQLRRLHRIIGEEHQGAEMHNRSPVEVNGPRRQKEKFSPHPLLAGGGQFCHMPR